MTVSADCGIEIERKYVILKPDESLMCASSDYTVSDITQIYLDAPAGVTHRVRSREYPDRTVYTETRKRRISATTAFEDEGEIDCTAFAALSANPKPGTRPIVKRRHTFRYLDQICEIDIYPEWHSTAIMETELADADSHAEIPPFITVVAEVTGDKRYSNASMSHSFPEETHVESLVCLTKQTN